MEHLPDSYIDEPNIPEPEPQYDDKVLALAEHLGVEPSEIEESGYDENYLTYGKRQYIVVTDSEADRLWEEDLDNYLEECVYPELPENMRNYFDDEKWKHDARMDGRAHNLGRYDGNEYEVKVNDEWYYIYRQN